jgi:hypothetical protein
MRVEAKWIGPENLSLRERSDRGVRSGYMGDSFIRAHG